MIIIQVKEGLKTMSSKYNIYFSREEYNKLMQIKEIQETATERVEKMTKQLKLKSNQQKIRKIQICFIGLV